MVAERSLLVAMNGAAAAGSLGCKRERERRRRDKDRREEKKMLHGGLNT
jgi:hypothetical protein